MKNKNVYMLLGGLIGLLVISAIIGLLAKSVVLGIKIIFIIFLLAFGLKAVLSVKTLLETFFNKED